VFSGLSVFAAEQEPVISGFPAFHCATDGDMGGYLSQVIDHVEVNQAGDSAAIGFDVGPGFGLPLREARVINGHFVSVLMTDEIPRTRYGRHGLMIVSPKLLVRAVCAPAESLLKKREHRKAILAVMNHFFQGVNARWHHIVNGH